MIFFTIYYTNSILKMVSMRFLGKTLSIFEMYFGACNFWPKNVYQTVGIWNIPISWHCPHIMIYMRINIVFPYFFSHSPYSLFIGPTFSSFRFMTKNPFEYHNKTLSIATKQMWLFNSGNYDEFPKQRRKLLKNNEKDSLLVR